MEQKAQVVRRIDDRTAMVTVTRKSACSGDCHTCHGCPHPDETVVVRADNLIGAEAGDWVIVESATGRVLLLAMLLYIMPLILFFAGYFVSGGGESRRALVGGLAFAAGLTVCVLVSRSMKKHDREMRFTISRFAE